VRVSASASIAFHSFRNVDQNLRASATQGVSPDSEAGLDRHTRDAAGEAGRGWRGHGMILRQQHKPRLRALPVDAGAVRGCPRGGGRCVAHAPLLGLPGVLVAALMSTRTQRIRDLNCPHPPPGARESGIGVVRGTARDPRGKKPYHLHDSANWRIAIHCDPRLK
jgi:hypothetical protein